MLLSKPLLGESHKRRRLSRWALLNAWKLAGLTALVTFVGVFIAVTLSLILRPTRSYFFPLLSDVDKHQPEGIILRFAVIAATVLFFATTTASILHCHTLRLFSKDRPADLLPTHAHADDTSDTLSDESELTEIVPTNGISPPARRRSTRISSLRTLVFAALVITVVAPLVQYPAIVSAISSSLRRISLPNLLANVAFYTLVATCTVAMCFLIWYFLMLQSIPDRPHPCLSNTVVPAPVPSPTHVALSSDPTSPTHPSQPQQQQSRPPLSHGISALAAWFVVILRPVCLTGQAVCMIKILGLWVALDTFSISNIRLVKIALLAALAFAEYTAAFFFAFFMTILAVDMRAKAPSPDLIPHI